MTRSEILDTAKTQITGQREQDYGNPEDNFGIIAHLWSEYTGTKLSSLDVAMMMCLLKIARIKNGGGTGDSFVDICGYAACGGEIQSNTKLETVPKIDAELIKRGYLPTEITVRKNDDRD